ncbi:MAG: gamma-glutamyltransferase family protein [Deltaproteobacteria bacterium]|jgi:gamma-glutamyltranspeptidase/glutathione hydrolase|nr:gamma-glutamyltransferase family protein [Deltaproteobacteria bacterium]
MVVAPHYLASQAGLAVLREGGNAVEAAIATAACLCVVYPHMSGLGGDAFWTIYEPEGGRVRCIEGVGLSGSRVSAEALRKAGHKYLPRRGSQAMLTCPGAVSGWSKALEVAAPWASSISSGLPLPLPRLLEDAIYYAEHGFPVSAGQSRLTREGLDELKAQPGFARQFLQDAQPPAPGMRHTLPALARTLRRLGKEGLEAFYQGKLAEDIAAELKEAGSPLTMDDLKAQRAALRDPLQLRFGSGPPVTLYNCPPPSQGVSSLMILGIYNRLAAAANSSQTAATGDSSDNFDLVHGLVESTKLAFLLRDAHLADPEHMRASVESWLKPEFLAELADKIDPAKAMTWHSPETGGDTVWFGVIDSAGRAVSCIQSIYFEFGSGVVLPESGITWHNRSLGFSLDPEHPNRLGPRKRPFHTLNPALAIFDDGRIMPYGCMGGEGQPQTQAALFSRYAWEGYDLQQAISAPRWLLGRAWGDASSSLKLESDFSPEVTRKLKEAGHPVELVPPLNDMMGHAGALVLHSTGPNRGLIEGAADPRSDGAAACW